MNNATHTLGIAIDKSKFAVNLRPLDSAEDRDRRAAIFTSNLKGFNALQCWLQEQHITQPDCLHACLESANLYGDPLAAWLFSQGYRVSMVNSGLTRRQACGYPARPFSDPIDAKLLADFGADKHEKLLLWRPLPDKEQKSRDLNHTRQLLQETREDLADLLEETDTDEPRESIQRLLADLDRELQDLDQVMRASS